MKRFPFKRHLIILGIFVLLLGIMVPLASFAKSSSGEPHHPITPAQVVADPASSGTSVTATTDANCGSPTILVAILHKGDVVNIQAEVVPTNGETFSGEQSEGEFLKVYDVLGDSITYIDYTASRLYSFVATGNDTLKACIIPPGPDGDELGTIAVQVTPAPPPTPTPIQDTRLAKIFFCLLDVVPIGSLVKIAGKGARFAQFEGKVFKVLSYTYTGLSTFTAVVQDIKTGQILEVGWAIITALPGGGCLDLIRDLTPIKPVS